MTFIEKYKALLFTSLIAGTLVLGMFSFSISKKPEFIAESFYELEPQTKDEIKEDEDLKPNKNQKQPNTNNAFNEDEEFKEMMRNFKSMSNAPTQDDTPKQDDAVEDNSQNPDDVLTANTPSQSSKNYALNSKERERFNKANDVLAMHSPKKSNENKRSNANSSVSFSLKNRQKVKLPPPVYLCETSGKVVVNITVNSQGHVTDTYINSSSTTTNQCLIDAALEYAENAIFNDANRKKQIGTITYNFIGK